jgi:SnoaL-like polyketide cyclase
VKFTESDLAERNAGVLRQAVERIWNCGDLTMADLLFDLTYVNHGGLIIDLVTGPEAIKTSVALYRTAFPDLHITIDRLVPDGEMVDLDWAAHALSDAYSLDAGHGSHGETLTGTTRSRLCNGQIVESWTTWDGEDALRRLDSRSETRQATRVDGAPSRYGRRQRDRRADG